MQVYNIGSRPLARDYLYLYTSDDIVRYGEDNLYPERVKTVALRSPLVKSAILLLADFFEGDGFEDEPEEVINDFGHNANDLLRLTALDLALYNGFAILVNFDGEGKKVSYYSLPFETVRYNKPNKSGRITKVSVCQDWREQNHNKEMKIEEYPLIMFGEDLNSINSPKGAVLYYTGLRQEYPLSKMDAVFDTAEANAEVQLFQLSNIRNGFHSATIFKHIGGFANDKEKQEYEANIQELIGAENANSTFVIDLDEDIKDTQLFEQLPSNNNDTIFDSTTRNILNSILQHFNVPPSLMGVSSEGAVFTQSNILDDFKYMIQRFRDKRLSNNRKRY